MKVLIHGNAPTVKTGYGVQIAYLAESLQAAGHEVAVSATYGCEGSIQNWRGVRVYPRGYEVNSNDLIASHAVHFFADTPRTECWIVTLIDVWAMVNPALAEFNIAAWVPVDHFPTPPGVLNFFSRTQAVPVAMSRFGERLLFDAGMDPVYIPLAVDTDTFKPTPTLEANGAVAPVREVFGIPADVFVVGMVAMNKGWSKDRKGFNEAFWAFGQFLKTHPDAILYVHADNLGGAEGQNLIELAIHAGIPDKNIMWSDQYAYRVGYTPEMLAGLYTAFDVLLAPSHGEGFCVPLIEAQACGCPVIVTDFSAQTELVGAGWLVRGQPEWDPAQHASYVCPLIDDVLDKLHEAHAHARDVELKSKAVEFAASYDHRTTYQKFWLPFLEQISTTGSKVDLERDSMPEERAVAVLCPVRQRPENVAPLVESFVATTKPGAARLVLVVEEDDEAEIVAVAAAHKAHRDLVSFTLTDKVTFAEKVNVGYQLTDEPWLLLVGDDVRFHPGWLDAARGLSAEFDVIGTNDGGKNPKVANGSHADHFFVRRAYVEEHGGSLDGPGVLAPECYRHWYVDMEIVKLAKARGVFAPCFASLVEHLHPGYDGEPRDAVHLEAIEASELDGRKFKSRVPLIEMQRTTRAKVA